MKRVLAILAAALLLAGTLGGCAGKAEKIGQAENEILTYTRIDPEKTTLLVSRSGNIYIDAFSRAFEERNPDVQVVCLDITGGNRVVQPLVDWVINGAAPDIMFSSANLAFDDAESKEYFVNLSTNPVVDSYQAQALNDVAIDGDIYWLPGPSNVSCMIYNKTLFDRYGWQIPSNFDEFVALCDQITKDTNGEVEPWNPNAKYSNEIQTALEGFVYEEVFAGADNRAWLDAALEGENTDTVSAHFEPLFNVLQTLVDHGILREDHFSYSATTRGKEFAAGKIAMINYAATDYDSDEYDFSFMPFPSTTGNLGYINTAYACLIGVPKKEHTEAEQDAINRYLAFFSSVEGQEIFIGDSLQISSVKDVVPDESGDLIALQPAVQEGHLFSTVYFSGEKGSLNLYLIENMPLIAAGQKTAASCLSEIAADPYTVSGPVEKPEVIATAEKSFTILETSFYIADLYREAANAEIGLVANNVAYRGNLMRIFAGPLNAYHVNTLMPRSLENGSTLVKVTMSGQELLDALNNPLGNDEIADCVYAYSGLKCEIAPWNELGARYLSVTLADGTPIDPSKEYSVAFWSGTVSDTFITGTPEVIEGTWEELMTAKLSADGTIAPAQDGRVKLVWN